MDSFFFGAACTVFHVDLLVVGMDPCYDGTKALFVRRQVELSVKEASLLQLCYEFLWCKPFGEYIYFTKYVLQLFKPILNWDPPAMSLFSSTPADSHNKGIFHSHHCNSLSLIAKGLIDLFPRVALICFCITDATSRSIKPFGVAVVETIALFCSSSDVPM